eukprot:1014230-Prorocentrum_minimum.AAC.4
MPAAGGEGRSSEREERSATRVGSRLWYGTIFPGGWRIRDAAHACMKRRLYKRCTWLTSGWLLMNFIPTHAKRSINGTKCWLPSEAHARAPGAFVPKPPSGGQRVRACRVSGGQSSPMHQWPAGFAHVNPHSIHQSADL